MLLKCPAYLIGNLRFNNKGSLVITLWIIQFEFVWGWILDTILGLREHLHLCLGLQTVGIFRVGSSKKRVRQVQFQLVGFNKPLHFNELYQLWVTSLLQWLSASRGVRPGMGGTFGWGAQCPWCSCIVERVPQRHAWLTANKRALHGLHQHNVWGARTHTHKQKKTSHHSLVKFSVVWCWLFCNWRQCGGLFFRSAGLFRPRERHPAPDIFASSL